MKTAVYPGTFDPVTRMVIWMLSSGHPSLFDRVIVGVLT